MKKTILLLLAITSGSLFPARSQDGLYAKIFAAVESGDLNMLRELKKQYPFAQITAIRGNYKDKGRVTISHLAKLKCQENAEKSAVEKNPNVSRVVEFLEQWGSDNSQHYKKKRKKADEEKEQQVKKIKSLLLMDQSLYLEDGAIGGLLKMEGSWDRMKVANLLN